MAKFIAWNNSASTGRPPLVVIDIGYSESDQSCGVWHDGATVRNSCQFYRAIELVAAQLNAALALDARPLLAIEAPLSRAHTARGNPTPRGDFEDGRRWYVQSGAMVTLAAIRLLEVLSAKLTGDVWIAEAFLSNKDESTAHWRDAMEIHTQFWSTPPIIPSAAEICPLCGLIDGVPDVRVFAVNAEAALLPPS
jgi:hypothetical protein